MRGPAATVLSGEYESGYSGEGLTVLDIGANVGAFTIWANMRWPGSFIHAYEPHPETFEMLAANTIGLSNVACTRVAVYSSDESEQPFFARYPGDGEAALRAEAIKSFAQVNAAMTFSVPVIPARRLPMADVIKIDVEGAEAEILESLPLEKASLILLEYQNVENRRRIKLRLEPDFVCVHEDRSPWSALLPGSDYRPDLSGDYWGHLFFVNRHRNRLRQTEPLAFPIDRPPALRSLVSALPAATMRALRRRLSRR